MPRILVIDDDLLLLNTIIQLLTFEGYRVSGTHDGNEGIRLHKENPFDLIITDLNLPGSKKGIEIISEITCGWPEVKIIAMSGDFSTVEEEILRQAERTGCYRAITKPFQRKKLLDVVRDLLQ